jgi:pyruvate/2-oxoglutarate dehydrogenase complex dihydrolipoamide dehydrogenase (E3) component
LGGQILCERFVPFKDDYFAFSQWLIRQLAKLPNVEVRLNTKVDPELVNILAPDVLLCAIGAEPIVPPIPGIDGENVRFIHDLKKAPIGGRKKRRTSAAGWWAAKGRTFHRLGKNVTFVEILDDVSIDAPFFHRAGLMPELEKGVRRLTNTKAKEIRPDGLLCAGPDGKELFLPADTVFCAVGMPPGRKKSGPARRCSGLRALGDVRSPAGS